MPIFPSNYHFVFKDTFLDDQYDTEHDKAIREESERVANRRMSEDMGPDTPPGSPYSDSEED